jgi:HlyD family secretion protein
MQERSGLFRAEAIERLQSPERLDELLVGVDPRQEVLLVTCTVLVLGALAWSILGRIPERVEGRGALLHPRHVVPFQATGGGRVVAIREAPGAAVEKGDVLVVVAQPELEQQLAQAREKLAKLEQHTETVSRLRTDADKIESLSLDQERDALAHHAEDSRAMAAQLDDNERVALKQERAGLEERKKAAQNLDKVLKERVERYRTLKASGDVRIDELIDAESAYQKNLLSIADIDGSLKQLSVKEVETDSAHREQLAKARGYELELKELDIKQKRLAQSLEEVNATAATSIDDVNREIARLEERLKLESNITATSSGRVLEVEVAAGQLLTPGQRMGAIEEADVGKPMVGIAFLSVGDGNKVKPGMKVRVAPDAVERERYGSIEATLTSVASFPASIDEAVAIVGNREVAAQLIADKHLIAVTAELATDRSTTSGYKWTSSKGPRLAFAAGTTATVQITTEERAPIGFVIPFLRSESGDY